jgi:hypothetical protein
MYDTEQAVAIMPAPSARTQINMQSHHREWWISTHDMAREGTCMHMARHGMDCIEPTARSPRIHAACEHWGPGGDARLRVRGTPRNVHKNFKTAFMGRVRGASEKH